MVLNPIEQFELVTVVGVIVVFVVVHLILRKTFFLKVIDVMERRQEALDRGSQVRAEGAKLVEEAQQEAERILAAAKAKSETAVAGVKDEADAAREACLSQASSEAEAILSAGREEVAAVRDAERGKMHDTLTACVVQTLGRLMDHVDERAVRLLVEQELTAQASVGETVEEAVR